VVSDYQLNEALTLLKGWNIMESGRQQRARPLSAPVQAAADLISPEQPLLVE
jgi:hypothetical protein